MTFLSALLLGLLASIHCAGMCGGLQPVLQQSRVIRTPRQLQQHIVIMNVGRVVTYVLMGVLFSLLGAQLILLLNLPQLVSVLRLSVGIILVLIGIQLWFPQWFSQQRFFGALEGAMYRLWIRVQDVFAPETETATAGHSLIIGILWGLLPCGLVYTVLLTATLSVDVLSASAIMLGFGLGTMPALVLTGHAYGHFRDTLQARSFRRAGAVVFICGGVLMIFAPLIFPETLIKQHPLLFNSVFCFTPLR